MNIKFRLVLHLLGYILSFVGVLMLIPSFIDLFYSRNSATIFFIFSLITIFVGFTFAFANRQDNLGKMTARDGLLVTILAWIVVVAFAALPLSFSYLNLSYVDAYFEIMSGVTTTGATVIQDLDQLSYGLHFWRALMQWIGGIGIIVISILLFPSIQGGGMQLFKLESFETFDSAFNKVKNIALGILFIYSVVTVVVIALLVYVANLNFFDSLIHSLTSVSTAGFSNKNQSVEYFNNPVAELILSLSMLIGGLPYILLYYFIFFRKINLFKDVQVIGYIKILGFGIFVLMLYLYFNNGFSIFDSWRYASFSVITLLTGTGLINVNYVDFGYFPTMFLFFLMFVGGCGGSTACGIKVYRFQIAYQVLKITIDKLFLNNRIAIPYYNNKIINQDMGFSVLVYFFIFFIILAIGSSLLSLTNLDYITALSATAACLTNVGPGLGMVGPDSNFSSISDAGKWMLSIIMLLGRLEILSIMVIFSKHFWKD